MGRASVNRPHIAGVRMTDEEVADLDARRGPLSRSEWLRVLTVVARRHNISYDNYTSWADTLD